MYSIVPHPESDLLDIRVTGKMSKADYQSLGPLLNERLTRKPPPPVLVVIDDFEGFDSFGALVEDVKLGVKHYGHMGRMALVGDRAWQKWMARIASPFAGAEIRYFDHAELEQAQVWAVSGTAA